MQTSLPDKFDPWKLADAAGQLQGEFAVSRLQRLAALLHGAPTGNVAVWLGAGRDSQGRAWLAGRFETNLTLLCQRCLTPLSLALVAECRLAPQHGEDAAELPEGCEALSVMEDGWVALVELVEDELLLALPMVPLHGDEQVCRDAGYIPPAPAADERAHPFAGLAQLLKSSRKDEE
ncbi:MAG TPA: YceD family protein [Candidatus Competibacteraceae bacterium]|nr:YceD family protein [Candidatus Competibacteraceae bacterium]